MDKNLAFTLKNFKEKIKENSEKLEQLRERIEKLENPEVHDNRDVSDNLSNNAANAGNAYNNVINPGNNAGIAHIDIASKLSNYAQKAAQDSRGPLKPDDLLTHFMSNDFGKKNEAMAVIRKFPSNIDEIKNQLSNILRDLETQVVRRKRENQLDIRLIGRIRKFNDTLEKEQEKGKKLNSKLKLQSNSDQSQNVTIRGNRKLFKWEIAGKSHADKQEVQEGIKGRKRKLRNYDDEDDDTCSSQEVEVEEVTANCKRLKLNPSTSSQKSIASYFRQHREPRPIIDSASSRSSSEDSTEIVKTVVKSTGKQWRRSNGDEETVHENQFSLRGKHIRRY